MTKLEKLEREVAGLTPKELAAFREWFRVHDADAWDRQIEKDLRAGKLDKLAASAVKAHQAGKTNEI